MYTEEKTTKQKEERRLEKEEVKTREIQLKVL